MWARLSSSLAPGPPSDDAGRDPPFRTPFNQRTGGRGHGSGWKGVGGDDVPERSHARHPHRPSWDVVTPPQLHRLPRRAASSPRVWRGVQAYVIASRAKAVAHLFSDSFFNGDATANPKAFDGITKAIPAAQTVAPGANGGALTLDLMDQMIDLVKPGRPDLLLMSKRTRRKLSSLRTQLGLHYSPAEVRR